MGNKLGRKRQVVDERYTRPQGLDARTDVDIKKLRKLILESKLAPCYPGNEDCCCDLEECPICFLCYPSLNRSRCCAKSICTECFLQMKDPNSTRTTHLRCPFCKTSNYAVVYRGVKTKEEKGIEQIEEQRVIEAQIKMRQQELQDEEDRMQKRQELSSSSGVGPEEIQDSLVAACSSGEEEIVSSQDPKAACMIKQPSNPRANREDEFDLDLEDMMVMVAIWQSFQENSRQRNSDYGDVASSVHHVSGDCYISPVMASVAGSSSLPSGDLVCALATLAEHQQMGGESSSKYNGNMPAFNMLHSSSRLYNRWDQVAENDPPEESPAVMPADGAMTPARHEGEWNVNHDGSEVAEAGTSYASSDLTEDAGGISTIQQEDEIGGSFHNILDPIVPQSYEEQMMLAMAVSLSESRSMTSGPGVSWQ